MSEEEEEMLEDPDYPRKAKRDIGPDVNVIAASQAMNAKSREEKAKVGSSSSIFLLGADMPKLSTAAVAPPI